jgi:tetratricopeptide (TPR) repeat protein
MRQNLASVSEKFEQYRQTHIKLKQDDVRDMFTLIEQATFNLRGLSSDMFMLCGTVFDERITIPKWIDTKNSTTLNAYYLMKIIIEYLFGDKNKVLEYEALAAVHENGNFGTLFIPDHVFFESLALCYLYELFLKSGKNKDNNNYLQRIKQNQKRMKKWADSCPANFGHKYYIIEAEVHSITGERIQALQAFEKGIELAKENEYVLEEAIGNELCAKFWMKNKREKYAKIHITEAHYAYKKWGCLPKVQKLEEEFPYLQSLINSKGNDISFSTIHLTASSTSSNSLDVKTVLKASQAISGEIVLDKLLSRIMKFVIENAGAQKGYLLLPDQEKLKIEYFRIIHAKPLE